MDAAKTEDMPALTGRQAAVLFGIAAAITLLNALKSLHIDDPFYYLLARQIVAHPLDPGGFDMFWFEWPTQASDRLVPPLLPYWLAASMALFGDQPFAWKLCLLPFTLLLVFSLHTLAHRFASAVAMPVVVLIAFSPAILPGFNLMLDVPAEALIFASLAVFMAAADRRSTALTLAAGLLAGLAMLTKYTGVMAPAAILLYATMFGGLRSGIVACAAATAVFLSWEWATFLMYGRSQFLFLLQHAFTEPWTRLQLAEAMWKTLGAVHVAVGLLALSVCGAPRWLVWALVGAAGAGFGLIAFYPIENAAFAILGTVTIAAILWAAMKGFRCEHGGPWWRALWEQRRAELFLLALMILEIVAYFAVSPFGAVRRLMGLTIVSTLLVGGLAAGNAGAPGRRRLIWGLAVFNTALGMGFYALDTREAAVFESGARQAVAEIHRHDFGARVWYLGHWGFQFYAERQGMKPLVPEHTQLRAGDWIVIPDRSSAAAIAAAPGQLSLVDTIVIDDAVKLKTHPSYYAGFVPLEHRNHPRLRVALYRADTDFTPRTGRDPETVAIWVKQHQGMSGAMYAMPALIRGLQNDKPRYRYFSAEALGMLGPRAADARPALQASLNDPDKRVRAAASRALEKIESQKP